MRLIVEVRVDADWDETFYSLEKRIRKLLQGEKNSEPFKFALVTSVKHLGGGD